MHVYAVAIPVPPNEPPQYVSVWGTREDAQWNADRYQESTVVEIEVPRHERNEDAATKR